MGASFKDICNMVALRYAKQDLEFLENVPKQGIFNPTKKALVINSDRDIEQYNNALQDTITRIEKLENEKTN